MSLSTAEPLLENLSFNTDHFTPVSSPFFFTYLHVTSDNLLHKEKA